MFWNHIKKNGVLARDTASIDLVGADEFDGNNDEDSEWHQMGIVHLTWSKDLIIHCSWQIMGGNLKKHIYPISLAPHFLPLAVLVWWTTLSSIAGNIGTCTMLATTACELTLVLWYQYKCLWFSVRSKPDSSYLHTQKATKAYLAVVDLCT